jgi:hypothetical protein
MHSDQAKGKFVELRASGAPMENIQQLLSISRATAFRWQHELEARITNLRLLQLESAQARVLGSYEDRLKNAVARLARYQAEMDSRDAKYMDMKELQNLILDARREVEKLTFTPAFLPEPAQTDEPAPRGDQS